jgi:hypothetical protein
LLTTVSADHLTADVKQPVEDEQTGAQSFRYVRTGTNHYSLAFTYECIAASRHTPIDFRMCGWFGAIEEPNILTMQF